MALNSVARIAAAPRLRIDWTGSYAVGGPSSATAYGATVPMAVWGNGSSYIPFSNPATVAGENPTQYVFNGRVISAIPYDGLVVDLATTAHSDCTFLLDVLWTSPITSALALAPATFTGQPTLPPRDCKGTSNGENCIAVVNTEASSMTYLCNYTNSAGVSGRTSGSVANGASNAGGMFVMPLAAGDTGVRSIQSVTTSADAVVSVSIVRRLTRVQNSAPGSGATAGPSQSAGGRILSSSPLTRVFAGSVLFPGLGNPSLSANPRTAWATIALDV